MALGKASECDLETWQEIADFIGCHPETAKKLEKDGLKVYRFGRVVRAKSAEVRAFVRQRETRSVA